MHVDLLCAGAAKGLVEALRESFEAQSGATIRANFGAVGALRERLEAGAPCDVLVLTRTMQDALAREGQVDATTLNSLGSVPTGIAVRDGEARPAVGDRDSLRASLSAATRIYLPDPERATAGIHFAKVLRELGIHDQVAPRLAAYPSGAIAMRALADDDVEGSIGCTQVTEILYTSGVALVGVLPPGLDLATEYVAAVRTQAQDPVLAMRLATLLAGPASRMQRERGGFIVE